MHRVRGPTQRETVVRDLLDVRHELADYRLFMLALLFGGLVPSLVLGVLPPRYLPASGRYLWLLLAVCLAGALLITLYLGLRRASRLLRARGIPDFDASSLGFVLSAKRMISSAERLGILEGRLGQAHRVRSRKKGVLVFDLLAPLIVPPVIIGAVWLLLALAPGASLEAFSALVVGAGVLTAVSVWLAWWRLRRS